MLDKEVVQFTREGVVKKNLATGKSTLVTHSDHAREMRYKSPIQESVYRSSHEHSERENSVEAPAPIRQPAVRNAKEPEKTSEPSLSELKAQAARGQGKLSSRSAAGSTQHRESSIPGKGEPASGHNRTQYRYGQPQKDVRYYYRARTDVGRIPTSAEFRKSVRRPGIGKRVLRYTRDQLFKGNDEKDENPGLETVGTAYRSVRRFRSGIQKLREMNQRRSLVFRTTERTAVPFGRTSAAAAQTSRTARTAAVQIGGTAQKAAGILKNPVVAKYVLIALAIFLGLILLCMLFGMMTESFVGSTTEHPELTAYVEQLDSDFQDKITSLKGDYEKDENNKVVIKGNDVINTDANVLAILATRDWTVIDLTPENKKTLAQFHSILNTFKVTKKDEKVKEQTNTSSGTTEKTKTIHHITIEIQVYTAKAKINTFGFTADQIKHILEMLELLDSINGTGVIIDQNGSSPSVSYDEPEVQALVTEANKYLGYPYVWGGSSPSTSFDCSGFVCWVFTHSGVHNLPRTTAQGIYDQCTPISANYAKPGDIIFFTKTYPTSSTVTHVGIYVGNGKMIHCGDPIHYTSINTDYWQKHFYSFGRLK